MPTAHLLVEAPSREPAAAILARFAASAPVDEATIAAASGATRQGRVSKRAPPLCVLRDERFALSSG